MIELEDIVAKLTPTDEQAVIIKQCEAAYKRVQQALGDLCVALLRDHHLDIHFIDDDTGNTPDGLNDRIERLTSFLLKYDYFDEPGHARVLYGAVGVSKRTLVHVQRLNHAKSELILSLPGGDSRICGASFNRVIARIVEPNNPRLNWKAVGRHTRIIDRMAPRLDSQGRMALKAIRLSVQDHYKANRVPLEDAYAYVGGLTDPKERASALAALPSASLIESENFVIRRDRRIRQQGVVNAAYWLEPEKRLFSRNFKTSTPVFYDIDGPELIVETSSRSNKNRDIEEADSRMLLEVGDYVYYRLSKAVVH